MSDFGNEIQKLSNYYINTYLASRGKIKLADRINIHKYKDLLDDSGSNKKSSLAATKAAVASMGGDKDA